MKKKFGIKIVIGVVLIVLLGVILYNQFIQPFSFENVEYLGHTVEFNNEQEQYLEDFNFAMDTLEQYYPFFEVNKIKNNLDFLRNKENYRSRIKEVKSDKEFGKVLNDIVKELDNYHTHLILDDEMAMSMFYTYGFFSNSFDWRSEILERYQLPKVQKRYNITKERVEEFLDFVENQSKNIQNSKDNVRVRDIVKDKIAYIGIKEMTSENIRANEEKIIKDYLQKVKDYEVMIIDIRGNGGGDSTYWHDFLLPNIIDRTYSQKTYNFIKDGELLMDYRRYSRFKSFDIETLESFNFPKITENIAKDFDYMSSYTRKINPRADSINYEGKVYLLVDNGVYSSSEMFASFVKESGFATLVGTTTLGDGIGNDPMQVVLDNTGYIMRFSKSLGVTEKGSINELEKTTPHIEVYGDDLSLPLVRQNSIREILKLEDIN